MPSITRVLLVALSALVLHVFATPMPMPLLRAADYRQQDSPSRVGTVKTYRIRHTTTIQESTHTELESSTHPAPIATSATSPEPRDVGPSEHISQLTTYSRAVRQNSDNLRSYAAQSASRPEDDAVFQQRCVSELTSFHSNMRGYSTALTDLFSDNGLQKGLANYDPDNNVETMMKDVVNANKDMLNAMTVLVNNIPGLGPILGPIVYEIKCIIDEILDATENLTDGLLNGLYPLLQPVITQAETVICTLGVCM